MLQTSGHHGLRKGQKGSGRKQNLRVEFLENRVLLAADLASLSPADDSADVATGSNLVLTFTEEVTQGPGTGNILILNADDGSLIEAVNVNSGQVTIDGANVTVAPSQALPGDTNVVVHVDAGSIRDTGAEVSTKTIFSEDFESLPLKNSGFNAVADNYFVERSGILDVQVAGEYTFGGNSDDGQALYIDVGQDGLDLDFPDIDDEIIIDNTTHGNQDRLSVCGYDANVQDCVGSGGDALTLAVGQYEFAYLYFEAGGGSSGEMFYAAGKHEAFDANEFVLVGDASKGIGVTADGITGTTYKSATEAIGDLQKAIDLVLGFVDQPEGFPASETLPTTDVYNSGGTGRFGDNHPLPGLADPSTEDFSDEGPYGWTTDDSFLNENRPGGPAEYLGWTFMNKELWILEQGDQSRTMFTKGTGVVALVDPDAYDDFVNIDAAGGDGARNAECLADVQGGTSTAGDNCGWFAASMATPKIYLDGAAENSAKIKFDSSWYDETTQSAEGSVEYFDENGESVGSSVLFRWESLSEADNYKPTAGPDGDTRDETVELELGNPANAASMIISFAMPYAQNDWWWAIDNIEVTADVAGTLFVGISDDSWTFTTGGETPTGLPGDIDGDGQVQFSDFVILSENFGMQVEPGTNGDIDGDGEVQFSDFVILSENFGRTEAPAAPAAGSSVDVVFAASDDGEDDSLSDPLGL